VLFEPIQGEGGINIAARNTCRACAHLRRRGWLFMVDEVQCGIGRTGKSGSRTSMPASEPDVMTLAKGLGSGVPIGACLAAVAAAGVFKPGNHGSTFGGNPLACAAALTTLGVIESDGLMARAAALGRSHPRRPAPGAGRQAGVVAIRGDGLMIGIELDRPCGDLVKQALEAGLLINVTADKVVRLLPPLVMSDADARSWCHAPPDQRIPRSLPWPHRSISCSSRTFPARSSNTSSSARAGSRTSSSATSRIGRCDRTLVMIFEKAEHAHAAVLRGRHAPARRLGDLPQHARLAARPRRAGGGRRQVISRMSDIVMIRTFEQDIIERFAAIRACR
jgi:hypothetical protein